MTTIHWLYFETEILHKLFSLAYQIFLEIIYQKIKKVGTRSLGISFVGLRETSLWEGQHKGKFCSSQDLHQGKTSFDSWANLFWMWFSMVLNRNRWKKASQIFQLTSTILRKNILRKKDSWECDRKDSFDKMIDYLQTIILFQINHFDNQFPDSSQHIGIHRNTHESHSDYLLYWVKHIFSWKYFHLFNYFFKGLLNKVETQFICVNLLWIQIKNSLEFFLTIFRYHPFSLASNSAGAPNSTTLPSSMTRILSECTKVDNLWAMVNTVHSLNF